MKKHLSTILIAMLLIVGSALLLYPSFSNYLNSKHASGLITDYNKAVINAGSEEKERMIKEAEDYNKNLLPGAFSDAGNDDEYNRNLDITGTGIMGYIDIDKIGVELPIYHGVEKEVLQIGAGHLEGSSLPVGGEGTHCVLSGHRGLPSAKLFTDLDELEVGDIFTIKVLDRVLTYKIDQIKVVLPSETEDLMPIPGEDHCTLLTCTPYGINTHRLLVRGTRVADEAEESPKIFVANEAFEVDTLIVAPVMAVPMFLITIGATYVISYIMNKKRKEQ